MDIFLFLSGVSLYYSLKKIKMIYKKDILDFYQRRGVRVLSVYFLFCVPWFIFRDILKDHNLPTFLRQVSFMDKHINSFWFIGVILICYLIYPFLYSVLQKGRKQTVLLFTVLYMASIMTLCCFVPNSYEYNGILTSRIPIFILGSIYAEKVYNDEIISKREWCFYLSMMLLWKPAMGILYRVPQIELFEDCLKMISRWFGGIAGIGSMLVLIQLAIVPLRNTKAEKFVIWISGFSLELYVISMAWRAIMLNFLHFKIDTPLNICVYAVVFVLGSVVGGFLLSYFIGFVLNLLNSHKQVISKKRSMDDRK